MKRKAKALVLFSGGLDSVLAVKILEKQGIKVAGICFASSFFGAEKAQKIARENGLELFVEDFNKDILNLVKNPQHGLGKNMNPCIDCHFAMLGRAKKVAREHAYDFLASGEVLGQRPFSQNKQALLKVAENVEGDILRPLSAKLLPETKMEKEGLVDRKQLLDIQGRQRNRQIKLAKDLKIKKFESPAGGCLLTDPTFGKRLKKALAEFSEISEKDVELLKWGRIYWVNFKNKPVLVVIGRKKEDNDNLRKLALSQDLIFQPRGITGPDILIRPLGIRLNKNIGKYFEVNVLICEEQPKDLDGYNFEKLENMLEKIVEIGSWYIKKSRGEKIVFEIIEK